jgi:hypothetical protein
LLGVLNDAFDTRASNSLDARETRPLVDPGVTVLVQEDAVAVLAWTALQRQCDEIAETAVRERVLAGEQAVVGVQPDVGALLHRLGEQVRPEPPRQSGWQRIFEEQPDVTAAS